jgi:hypothetical protein
MSSTTSLEMTLLPGARELLAAHTRELPQRDDFCGAFCGALALSAAGFEVRGGEPLDQDAVARAAGSVVSAIADPGHLPYGETGRRDYRLTPPLIEDGDASGTTAAGLAVGIGALSDGAVAAIPYSSPWTAETLGGLFDTVAALERPATLVANLATRHLWGGRPSAAQVLAHLLDGAQKGPPPDWDVGHFVCVFGCLRGPGGSLYGIADTYPALGAGGVHLQPAQRLARAIERREEPAGGVIVVAAAEDAPAVRAGAAAFGLTEGIWDNGTITAEAGR